MKESSIAGKNIPQLTIDCTGKREVEWYDWSTFLSEVFRPIPKITSYHHFQFSENVVGDVSCKEYANSLEVKHSILRPGKACAMSVIADKMPNVIIPKGLDAARQWYLFEQIRPFCHSNLAKDLTCPMPNVPKPGSHTTSTPQPRSLVGATSCPPKRKCRRKQN